MKFYRTLLLFFASSFAFANSDLMLLHTYNNQPIEGWVMSEKLDGVRGYWNGKQLLTRQGQPLSPPAYFIKDFPPLRLMANYLVSEIILRKFHPSQNLLKAMVGKT